MYQRTFKMKRRFQFGATKRKEKSMRLENESKGKVTFEQLGWGKSTENKISQMQVQDVLPSTNAEKQVIQSSQKELEAVNEGSGKKENEIEAHVVMSQEKEHIPEPLCQNTELLARYDVTTWDRLSKGDRDRIVANGPLPDTKEFPKDQTGRVFPTSILWKFMPKGESIRREWLIWSDNCKALFCFSCCLFNESPPSQAHSLFSHPKLGFRGKWKKLYEK